MVRIICILTAILVIPFGIAAVLAPAMVFGQFGMTIDVVGAVVARGYGATALGYGIVFLMLRNAVERGVVLALLVGALVFNGLEVLVQVPFAFAGLANAMIWVTICGHALVGGLAAVALVRGEGR